MNYKEAFAVDEIYYSERKKDSSYEATKFELNNFDYYKPKLVDDFYLKYFTRKLLIEIDILELKDFLQYHYDYCDNPDAYFSILEYKIIPKIREIVEFAQPSFEGGGYHDEIKLEDGFVESEGVIHNSTYDYGSMNHYIAFGNLQKDVSKRAEIITSFLTEYIDKRAMKPLKWIAGPANLGIIIRELIDKGFIEAEKYRGEINCSSLSRDLLKAFSVEDCNSSKSIEIYLNSGSKKHAQARKSFDSAGFHIPFSEYT
jgi:hypothetical protein